MNLKYLVPAGYLLGLLTFVPVSAGTTIDYPSTALRGYGTVSGTFTSSEVDGKPGSLLSVTCENEDKAKLLLAKFLSDEQTLPGVTQTEFKTGQWGVSVLRLGGTSLSAYEVKGQGLFAALRLGPKVLIVASPTRDGLVATADNALKGNTAPVVSAPEVEVPMWLDRWDKHGFRFYYAAWMVPPKEKNETYDFRGDFTFAKDSGVGMVFWDPFSLIMGADGQTTQTFWNHNVAQATQANLPLAINLSTLNYDIPSWMANRYRDGMQQPMPDYLGDSMSVASWRGTSGKVGEVAWGATPARDAMLGAMQAEVRRFVNVPNVVSWMEPLNELSQGGDDFMGYGPACDATYRDYLRSHYGSVDKVGQAWFGKSDALKSWDDIHAPELASFLGWSPDALDLAGNWRVNFTDGKQPPQPEWLAPVFDDSKWQPVTAPGDDRNFQLPKTAAVYRRNFDLPADWLAKHPRVWIYLWDLNVMRDEKQWPVAIYLNGQKAGESPCHQPLSHWMSADATAFLKPGPNQITLTLPSGYIGYRIYLSGTEPKQYPNLGEGLNTQWVDFADWRQTMRTDSVRRGMQMIREIDPDRPITLASPWYSVDGLKGLAQEYGGEFHDTGFMSGSWTDLLPSLMRGSGLPCSLEPGGPPDTVDNYRRMVALWETHGMQQTDYFLHMGDVEWNPEIRKQFEADLPMLHLIGKYHIPQADLAFLFSSRDDALAGFPWNNDLNTNLPGGWTCWGMAEEMMNRAPRDAITEGDFARGNAARYKVIIDLNTSIMDQAMIDQIEKYVRDGGIFITFGNTGRHTPTQPNSWPISKLTGYQVLTVEQFNAKGGTMGYDPKDPNPAGSRCQPFHPAAGQTFFPKVEPWMTTPWVTGLRMKKVADDAQDLLVWEDGTIAAGLRKIGKGMIVDMGCKVNGQPWLGVNPAAFLPFLQQAGVKMNRTEVGFDKPMSLGKDFYFRDYDSNNGLYDVSVIANETGAPVKATLTFKDAQPATALDVTTNQEIPVANGKLDGIALDPLQMKIFLTPRNQITQAPADWFELQQRWWKAAPAVTKPLPKGGSKFALDLDEDWAWHAMADKEDPAPYLTPVFDDSKWPKLGLGAWNAAPERKDVKDGLMRRTFTIPKEWNNGTVGLWVQTGGFPSFADEGAIWLDGKQLQPFFRESSVAGLEVGGGPGSSHILVVEAKGPGQFIGLIGDAWLTYIPKPVATVDLAGTWTTCKDDIFHDTGTVNWPGGYEAHSLWRTINVPKEDEGKTVMLMMQADRPFQTFINGTQVQYSGTPTQNSHVGLNITPWIRFGQDNRIQLISRYNRGNMARVTLDMYKPGTYP